MKMLLILGQIYCDINFPKFVEHLYLSFLNKQEILQFFCMFTKNLCCISNHMVYLPLRGDFVVNAQG